MIKFSNLKKTLIIAEIGNNHEGSIDIALELIERAAEAGVDAVKFQTYIPEKFISNKDFERLSRLNKFKLKSDDYSKISKKAEKLGLIFFSTPLDLDSADFLNNLQDLFKISSGDNNFYPLIRKVSQFNKPTLISTGLVNSENIDFILKYWIEVGGDPANLCFMHCVSSYPVPENQVNISVIHTLIKEYPKVLIGYSDHTVGIKVPVLAVAAGAKIIEKHFTLDKQFSSFRDHQLSADPKEMEEMVNQIRDVEIIMGVSTKKIQPCELESKVQMRRSIAASRDLVSGTVLCIDDLTWVRPGVGFAPGLEETLIGQTLNLSLARGELILKKHLK
jgi:N,N'-diacetyllegionaminate synthase